MRSWFLFQEALDPVGDHFHVDLLPQREHDPVPTRWLRLRCLLHRDAGLFLQAGLSHETLEEKSLLLDLDWQSDRRNHDSYWHHWRCNECSQNDEQPRDARCRGCGVSQ